MLVVADPDGDGVESEDILDSSKDGVSDLTSLIEIDSISIMVEDCREKYEYDSVQSGTIRSSLKGAVGTLRVAVKTGDEVETQGYLTRVSGC